MIIAKCDVSKICLIFLVVIILSAYYPSQVKAEDDYYHRNFEWEYDGRQWTWNLSIPKSLYDTYRSVSVSERVRNGPAGYGFLTTTRDYYLKSLAEKLNETATQREYSVYDEVSFVLAFVQSLPYTSDSVTSGFDEYPRFPLETLVDGGGDCEDTSILFATLTLIMNYSTVYINPPKHYAVGVLGKDLPGYYWTYNNKTYYYCETTGEGFKIGEIPDEYKDAKAYIYDIKEYQQYVPTSWSSDPSIDEFMIPVGPLIVFFATATILIVTTRQFLAKKEKEQVHKK